MSIIKEFKEFALRGNVIDLAVAVVIGGAFGKIVSSFVADVLMPPIGLLLGGVNFTDLVITLKKSSRRCGCCNFTIWKFYTGSCGLSNHRSCNFHDDKSNKFSEEKKKKKLQRLHQNQQRKRHY